ncbi:CHASE domain-containing protein [Argonema antarcticum]|uniref:CHASE domain-containing protein n=1 Tax=Argonema antarcticum TaxID=2942763 RepID=UPI002012B5A5|nr:CHASE domain-containing protein [Argonema antarcticum]MCL1470776.1 CHASE domain-containing protein [Argonema antarcticum A004/B2]
MALPRKRRYTPALLMLCAGIFSSFVASLTVGNWERENRKTQFQNQADKLATALQQSIDTNLGTLRATGNFYRGSQKVDRQEFEIFVRDFLTRYPSIFAFGWSQRVLAKDRQVFEQAIRAEGYANFQIQERSSQGKMVRAGERLEYFPVTYTSALSNQNGALGLDLISDSMRRSPLKKAGDTGAMSSTGRIELVTTKQLSFLTYQPIYLNGASLNSLQSRRQNFLGVTTAVFQIADIVKAALPELELDNINFYLFDDSAAVKDRFLSFYQSENQQLVTDINREIPVKIGVESLCWKNLVFCTRKLKLADRQWSILLLPTPGYLSIQTYWGAGLTLSIGLLLTTFITIYMMMSLRHTFQVEQLVQQRTAQAKQLSETLKILQQNMEMLDLANDSIIIQNLEDKITYWNQGAERLYGWTKTECVGQYIHTFLQTVFPKPLEEVMAIFLQEGHWEGELIQTKRDGTQIIVASRWTLQRDDLGYIIAKLEINNDITERKQAEEDLRLASVREREKSKQLEQAMQELQKAQVQLIQTEKMSGLGQLVAGVAHEINNPVNFIYGNLTHTNEYVRDLLQLVRLYQQHYPNPDLEIQQHTEDTDINFLVEDLPNMLSSMKIGAERIRQIVLSLRNFSRLDEAEMKQVDIHEGIDNTLLILQNRLKSKQDCSAIEVIKEYGNLPLVECYAGQLNQVFMNIIANAIDSLESRFANDALEQGRLSSRSPTISIRTEMLPPDRVAIRIADNGSGMTPEVQKQLFNPFFTTKPVGKGTGLGLSICYQIVVEKHGGILRCESELGKGTEFWIEIQVRQSASASGDRISGSAFSQNDLI